jgi:CheY-like chemotaxis protein
MKRLLDDLLEVSRVTQGKIQLDHQQVDVAEVVIQALDTTGTLIEEYEHELHLDLPEMPVYVNGDADRLMEVVSNLVTNAAKYTPEGGKISVSVSRAGKEVEISVSDDGFGIPEEIRDSLFDLFVQLPQGPHRPSGGLGVGLTLVKQLVNLHGGEVEAISPGSGKGSQFLVRLPLWEGPDPHTPESARTYAPARQRILLVEDNADAADMLAFALQAEGHEVEIARDGEAALAAVSKRLPDLVLVDIGLPDMDGIALTRRLRETYPNSNLVIIAVSGYGDEKRRREAQEAGVDHYVLKP